jgi:hypothetical protein
MKLNKEAAYILYGKGVFNIPKIWTISLLDTYTKNTKFNDNSTSNILCTAKFSVVVNKKTLVICNKDVIKLSITVDRIAYIRSAIINITKKAKLILSAGMFNCELCFTSDTVKSDTIEIYTFSIDVPFSSTKE